MYEDLRSISDEGGYFEEEDPFEELDESIPQTRLWGMTAGQRLLISIMLLATVLVMAAMALLVLSKVWLF